MCSCPSSWICKLPTMMLCMHVTVQTHNHIQFSLPLNSGNSFYIEQKSWIWDLKHALMFFSVFKSPYSAAVLWNVVLWESPDCEMWGFFFFFCWSAVGFCDLQPISVQYILYVFVSETAQCLQEMHSFAVGHMGSFAFLWWRWEDKVCCLLFFSFLKLLLCFVPAYSWSILKDAWDNAEFSPSKHLQQTIKFLFSKFRRTTF